VSYPKDDDIVSILRWRVETINANWPHAQRIDIDAITEINRLRQRIKELEDGSCRYNCRTMKEAFMAGHLAGQKGDNSLEAYKAWRDSE